MRLISDIEIHSKYSRACSPALTPENIGKWADIKGVQLIGTGDFTHPKWIEELKAALEPAEEGLYKLRNPLPSPPHKGEGNNKKNPSLQVGEARWGGNVRFILSAEISCIFSQGGKLRRVHLLCYSPSFASVEKFNKLLADKGAKLAGDGRPILGMSCAETLKYLKDADSQNQMVPAHVWTPYFGIFGSKSGFDSIDEAFGEQAKEIFAIETGLSSDPAMNYRLSRNDRLTLVSSSDAHSLPRIGREANVMEIPESELSYGEFMRIIREKDTDRFKFTIEYFPEEGKYHMDGHRDCGLAATPKETEKYGGRCPKCGRKITVGVLSRVEELADRGYGEEPKNAIPGKHLVPLEEVLAECAGKGVKTKTVQGLYWQLIEKAGNEFAVILDMPIGELKKVAGETVAEAVKRVREEKVNPIPGYDGEYGVIKIFTDEEREHFLGKGRQKSLF